MMNDNSVSSFMAMADAALEKALRADLDLAEAKRCAQEDVRKAIAAGLISVRPCGVPGKYKKKTNVVREKSAFSLAEIKEMVEVIDRLVADGMTISAACRVSGIRQGNLGRWRGRLKG